MATNSIDLDEFRIVLAEAQRASKDNGSTLDLSDQRIAELPIEILEVIQNSVARYVPMTSKLMTDLLLDITSSRHFQQNS